MRFLARPALLGAAAVTVGLLATGCNSSTQGSPTPTVPANSSSSASTSSSTSSAPKLDPCDLLSSQQATQLGLQTAPPTKATGIVSCKWDKGTDYALGFDYFTDRGMDQINANGDQSKPLTVGNHDAMQLSDANNCTIALSLTHTTALTVIVTGAANNSGCQLAAEYAQLVEPKLPAEQK